MGSQADIPKQYKACVYNDPGKVSTKIEMLDMPEPGPGEVLINLYVDKSALNESTCSSVSLRRRTHSGVCHSDMGVMENSVGPYHAHCRPQRSRYN